MNSLGGLVGMVRRILFGTVVVEGIGAVFYAIQFSRDYGLVKGIWYGVFHSVSAFCNAGIDILGEDSLARYVTNPLINITTMMLIILGGIGFTVWYDVIDNGKKIWYREIPKKWCFTRLKLHSKIAIVTTLILLIAGTLLNFVLEYRNPETIENLNTGQKIMASAFQAVTTRTAGFSTFQQSGMHEETGFLNIILMFIGVFYFGLEAVLYTLLAFFVMFKTCNAFTDGFDYKKNIIIISEHYEEIGNGIIEVIGRGVTYLYAEGAYTHQQRKVLLVVAKLTQVAKIKQIVRDIDPGCFMIIQDANDVFGKGFTSKPSAHKKNKKIFCTVDTLKQKS